MTKTIELINHLNSIFESSKNNIQATLIYNEDWMLRCVLTWFEETKIQGYPLSFAVGSNWKSEPRLHTPFSGHSGEEKVNESNTNADAVISQSKNGKNKSDLDVTGCTQFVICEAKMNSPLSSGTTNAENYDQAARNVGCLLYAFEDEMIPSDCAFYVLMPEKSKYLDETRKLVSYNNIYEKLLKRIESFPERKNILALLQQNEDKLKLEVITWEMILHIVEENDKKNSEKLKEFYKN